MTTNYPTLQQEFTAVIDNLKGREWIQGEEQRPDGAVCAHGAVMTCQGLRPGDAHIIRAVMRAKGLTEGWNDMSGRTKDEVIAKLGLLVGVTDEDLAETFGPSWALVVAVIRRAAVLTEGEARSLAAARDAAWAAARDAAAWAATRDATRAAARDAAWAAARDAAARAATRDAAWAATRDAARAASVADLVGQHGLTQEHINTLMAPWVQVLGTDWADA